MSAKETEFFVLGRRVVLTTEEEKTSEDTVYIWYDPEQHQAAAALYITLEPVLFVTRQQDIIQTTLRRIEKGFLQNPPLSRFAEVGIEQGLDAINDQFSWFRKERDWLLRTNQTVLTRMFFKRAQIELFFSYVQPAVDVNRLKLLYLDFLDQTEPWHLGGMKPLLDYMKALWMAELKTIYPTLLAEHIEDVRKRYIKVRTKA